jgi:hypothetical protein
MATLGAVLLGAALVALAIAIEAGALRTRPLRRRGEPRYDPAGDSDKCVATTADGQQCTRVRTEGHRRYCWQHQRMAASADGATGRAKRPQVARPGPKAAQRWRWGSPSSRLSGSPSAADSEDAPGENRTRGLRLERPQVMR